MKMLKKVLLPLLIAASIGAVSTSALAETDKGRIVYAPADAINLVLGKIKAASDAAAAGTEGDALADLIKEASDGSKEINANDKVDRARATANNVLKAARKLAQEGKKAEAEEALKESAKKFEALKNLL
ncbi:hypothetical protein [Candidatus Methylobacter oryzae]|uniref:Uncharacterized protein n=1 Tax=Candidatus Methylobacter oryzae TaxID=2497749 RepID=A0ABY3C663_9GAMM|nr:hypothetical protein [Candidatus Methylobacter oryzae]TRW90300.1 hypothetical protein EKO24_019905 [Candidatus Methylobacter oryzae]